MSHLELRNGKIFVIFSSIWLSSLNCCIYSCLFQECKQHCNTNRALSSCRAEQAKQEVGAGKLSWQAWHKWPENTGKGFGGTFLILGNNVKFNVCEKFLGVTAGTNNCTEKRRDRWQSVKKGICRCYIFLSIWSKYKENTQFRQTNKPSIKTDIFFYILCTLQVLRPYRRFKSCEKKKSSVNTTS